MKKIIQSISALIVELIFFVLFTLWYLRDNDYEPLIGLIGSIVSLIVSFTSRKYMRPKLVLHKENSSQGRLHRGYTANNPDVIVHGIDAAEHYWEIRWVYTLEIRNNSSETAYNIKIEYQNLPKKTIIEGSIGKNEPILANDVRVFHVRLVENIVGKPSYADQYLKDNEDIIAQNLIINLSYKSESDISFYTKYHWVKDENNFPFFI